MTKDEVIQHLRTELTEWPTEPCLYVSKVLPYGWRFVRLIHRPIVFMYGNRLSTTITEEHWKMKTREQVLASIKQWPTNIDDVNAPDGWSWSHKGAVPLLICNNHPDQIITRDEWFKHVAPILSQLLGGSADPTSEPIKAHEFLERGAQHMRDRSVQRDASDGERSMRRAVEAFNAQEGTNLTEVQGWRFMIQLKYARAVNGVFVADDYEDMAAYAGLAGESAQ